MRPTERAPSEGLRLLADGEVPDFLEGHRVALLAFLDRGDAACAKMEGRIRLVAAKWEAAGPASASPAAGRPVRFGAGVVEVSRHRLVAEAMGVKAVPTVVLFADGHLAERLLGTPPEAVLDEAVGTHLARIRP